MKKIFVNEDISDSFKKNLQKNGYIVIKALKKLSIKQIKKNAKIHKCEFYLDEKKIFKAD